MGLPVCQREQVGTFRKDRRLSNNLEMKVSSKPDFIRAEDVTMISPKCFGLGGGI
jgi:hypothetical protein